jgi:hypothetical protein
MELSEKLAALEKIYGIYDKFAASLDLACRKYCAHCCTTSVTLTTVEAYKIVMELESNPKVGWIEKIRPAAAQTHFKPKITTNQLAYAVRPFGCRCLLSRHDCGTVGYADMEDYVLAVNTVFLQCIEHMDDRGCTGNLLDMLEVMASEENRQAYEKKTLKCSAVGLITNQPLNILMIPPEHRTKMEPVLRSLQEIHI